MTRSVARYSAIMIALAPLIQLGIRFWRQQLLLWCAYGLTLMIPWIGTYPLAVMLPNKGFIAATGMLLSALLAILYESPRFRALVPASRLASVLLASLTAGLAFHIATSLAFGRPLLSEGLLGARATSGWVPELGGAGYQALLMLAWSMGYLFLSAQPRVVQRLLKSEPVHDTEIPPQSFALRDGALVLRDGPRTVILDPSEVEWLGAEGDYVRVHWRGRSQLIRTTLTHAEKTLYGANFVRIHRSTVVNILQLREILSVSHAESIVVLRTGIRLKASRTYAGALRDRVDSR